MAQAPPPGSVVVKTKKPTPLQQRLARQQKLKAQGAAYDEAVRTGRIPGSPADIGGGLNRAATAGAHPAAIPVDTRGLVRTPIHGLDLGKAAPLPDAPVHKPKAKIVIHPDGRIEVHSGHSTKTATPTSYAPTHQADAPAPGGIVHSTVGPDGTIRDYGINPNPKAKVKPKALVRSATTAGSPMSDFDLAQSRSSQLLDPVIKQITDAINARTNAQQSAVTGYTGELARLYGLYAGESGKAFDQGIASTATVNDALANRLAGVTSSTGTDLAAKLASISADPATAARISGDVAAAGKGAGNAGFALGSADLSSLIGQKTNAGDYGAKLPGLAGLYGLQATKQAQGQGSTDLASALTQLEGNAPSLATSLLSQIQTNRNQQQQLDFEKSQFGVKTKQTNAAATVKSNTADASLSKALGFLVNAQGDPVLKGGKIVEMPQSTSARKANASLSKSLGYVVDAQGEPILRGGKKIIVPKSSTVKAATPATRAKALGLARVGHAPGPSGEPPVTWQKYLDTGLSKGIPAGVLIEEGRKVYTQAEIHQGLIPGSG